MSSKSRLNRLVLADRHDSLGARFSPFAGWEMPLQYGGVIAEHRAVRETVGVFDVSHMGRVVLRGPDSASRLRSATTYDVRRLATGEAHYSLYCNDEGGIDDDVFIYRLAEESWLIVHNAANAESDFELLREVVGHGVSDITRDTVMLAVQGPEAMALLAAVVDPEVSRVGRRSCVELDWHGSRLIFARTGYTGEDGGEVIVQAALAERLWDGLMEAGASPAGLGARDTLRLEAALPLYGNDLDVGTSPFEAGLGFAVSLDDDQPFRGREALSKARQEPLARRLSHLVARERGVPRAGFAVRVPGATEVISHLTSGTFSPSLRIGIGMAYLPVALAQQGTILEVDVRGRALPVEVVRRPFYRP